MGRPERPLDPAAGPVQAFASELRDLRESAGRPKYSTLAQRTGRSQTALSEAAGGQHLPSWETVEAFVRGCGGDPAAWRSRWQTAATAAREVDPAVPAPPPESHPNGRWFRHGRWIPALLVTASLVAIATALWLARPGQPVQVPQEPSASDAPMVSVADGADPMDTGCSTDPQVVTLDSVEVVHNQIPVGRIELRYAPRCGAAWPRFSPFSQAQLAPGVVIRVDAYRPADAKRESFQGRFAGAAVFGNMLRSTGFCVAAAVRIDGQPSDPEIKTACFRGRVLEQQ